MTNRMDDKNTRDTAVFTKETPTVLKRILNTVAGITGNLQGAFNIRVDGSSIGRQSTKNIEIRPKPNGAGIEIYVRPGTKGEYVHIPVVVDKSGFADMVYNDFYIGDGADVDIIAGCGIHNDGEHLRSMTAYTPSMWERARRSDILKSTTAKETEAESGC